jgi:hypothetical protein
MMQWSTAEWTTGIFLLFSQVNIDAVKKMK